MLLIVNYSFILTVPSTLYIIYDEFTMIILYHVLLKRNKKGREKK